MLFSHVPVEILLSCLLSGDQAAKPRDLQGALFHRPVHRQLELSEIRESTVICFYWCTLCSLHNWPPTAPFTSTCTHSRCDRLTQCHALYAHVMLYMLILQLFMLMFSLVDWIHAHVLACCCSLTVAAANTLISNQGTGLIHCCSVSADHSQLGMARAVDKKPRSVC